MMPERNTDADSQEDNPMSFEYLADPSRPAWAGLLPGKPEVYFLPKGEGEHAKVFADTFSVLVSGDETEGQFGMFTSLCPAGDIIPTHSHADTHETFYILDGKVRLFVQLPDGEKLSRLLSTGDFAFVPAGAAARVPGGAGRADRRRGHRRLRTLLPADGYAGRHHRPELAAVRPGIPADEGGRRGAPDAVHARLRLAGRLSR